MRQYEVTFIIDPVLPNEEIMGAAKNYQDQLGQEGCEIVHVEAMGLRPLAYPINKRTSGIYFSIEFTSPTHDIIDKLELSLRRDERIMRFLTIKLDKFGVKYNKDKRDGLIGKSKRADEKSQRDDDRNDGRKANVSDRPAAATPVAPATPVVPATPAIAAAPVSATTPEVPVPPAPVVVKNVETTSEEE